MSDAAEGGRSSAKGGRSSAAVGAPRRRNPFAGLLVGLNAIGTVWIFVLMLVINADVFGRTVFSSPLPGVPELVRLSIVGIVFLQIGYTLRSGRITRVESLSIALARRWPRFALLMQGCYSLCGAALFVILFVSCRPIFVRAWINGDYAGVEGYVTYPFWPIYLILLIGCACSAVQYLVFAWNEFSPALGGRGAAVGGSEHAP
jgi:TRAP-type C4-dicarboxylate transport system permease small subunit